MSELVTITLETHEGSRYVLPDVTKKTVGMVTDFLSAPSSSISIGNASGAVLVVPRRIVRRLLVDDQEAWCSPISTA